MESSSSDVLSKLFSWVQGDLRIWLLLFIILTLILLVILFRREIADLLQRLSNVTYKGFSITFGENLEKAKQQKKNNNNLTGTSRAGSRPEETYLPSLSGRDLVLEAWGSIKQIIYDAAVAQKIQLTVATSPLEALNRLKLANIISAAQHDHIELLYGIGRLVADTTSFPNKKDAVSYHGMVYDVLDWMMSNAFSITVSKPSEPQKISRKTQVGSDVFAPPSPGQPAAQLICISGPKKGCQFQLAKMVNTIGTSSDNDVVIDSDKFISSHHAQLRFDQSYLVLSDLNSKNGTFLNGTRLKNTPITLKSGDEISIGNSIFELI